MDATEDMAVFDWSVLHYEDQDWLRDTTGQLRSRVRNAAIDIIWIGAKLREVRSRIGSNKWCAWIQSEFAWSQSTAYRLISVADAFEKHVSQIGNFEPSALYVLAQPTTPAGAREYAIERAMDGEEITHAKAREYVAAWRPRTILTPAEVRQLQEERKSLFPDADKDAPQPHTGWDAMTAVARQSTQFYVSATFDEETGETVYHGRAWPTDDNADMRAASADRLDELFVMLANRQPVKTCKTCGVEKPLFSGFGRDANQTDGRLPRCRECERPRYAESKRKKREKTNEVQQ